ncbi:glycoside hydrolase family 79 protein [Pleomassaria siparia CBS 279.74]|uniref:Glycoside hydrolase family 79 protein n=1 Tax=Pleomassaria siparia CBS 279.74 TaxID=1314801 RepID=A0A6G1JTP3_9PLEO|nr:glycoside hydrolase family 79 protein [Pleomassaria siparia CBS 279.74]
MFALHHGAAAAAAPAVSLSLILVCATTLSLAQNITLSPATTTTNASLVSAILDPSFAGFGIEPSNLFDFAGGETANALSIGLLQNLADYSGAPPHIRLGGNTGDYALFDASYANFQVGQNPKATSQGTIPADNNVIGPAYFEVLERFPKDTPVTFGLNMAYYDSDYIDQIVRTAQAAVDGMKNVNLYSFEVGNEPDLWLQNKFRNGSWGGKTYMKEFLDRADAVYNQVLKPAGYPATFFEAQATASTIGTTFEIDMLVADGMLNATNGNKYVSLWNQHDYFYFIGVTTSPMTLDDLMDLDNTETQFLYWKQQSAIAIQDTGLPFALREMSSVGPIGMHQVSDTHGAALWTLNFFLYTATLNISSVQMHMTSNSNASAWQPIDLYGQGPHVRPLYYGHAAMAQIIGGGNATTQIGLLDTTPITDTSYTGRIRAYTAYSKGALQSVILINTKPANASSTTKGNFTFTLALGAANADTSVFLSYLTADGSDALDGTTWNGMAYADADGTATQVDDTVVSLRTSSTGDVTIPVRDSQAIVANIGHLLGTVGVLDGEGHNVGDTTTALPTCTASSAPSGTAASCVEPTGAKKKSAAVVRSVHGGGCFAAAAVVAGMALLT